MKRIFLINIFFAIFLIVSPSNSYAQPAPIDCPANSFPPIAGMLDASPTDTNPQSFFINDVGLTNGTTMNVFYYNTGDHEIKYHTSVTITSQSASFSAPSISVNGNYLIWLADSPGYCTTPTPFSVTGNVTPTPTPVAEPTPVGAVCIPRYDPCNNKDILCCTVAVGYPVDLECNTSTNTCLPFATPTPFPTVPFDPCLNLAEPDKTACTNCRSAEGAYTALGCIPLNPGPFVAQLINLLIVIGIGVAFLLIVYGSFLALTSRGNPQQTQSSRETITAAIVGLILLIFALALNRLIFGNYGILPGIVDIFN